MSALSVISTGLRFVRAFELSMLRLTGTHLQLEDNSCLHNANKNPHRVWWPAGRSGRRIPTLPPNPLTPSYSRPQICLKHVCVFFRIRIKRSPLFACRLVLNSNQYFAGVSIAFAVFELCRSFLHWWFPLDPNMDNLNSW